MTLRLWDEQWQQATASVSTNAAFLGRNFPTPELGVHASVISSIGGITNSCPLHSLQIKVLTGPSVSASCPESPAFRSSLLSRKQSPGMHHCKKMSAKKGSKIPVYVHTSSF